MNSPFDRYLASLESTDTQSDKLRKLLSFYKLRRFTKQDDSEDEDRLRYEEDAAAREEEEEEADEDARRSALDDGGGDNFGKDHHASRVADLLVEAAQGRLSRPQALLWLLRHKDGNALLHRLRTQKREVIPMTREQELSAIAKKFGITTICKGIIDDGPRGISEHEITKLIQEAASRAYPDLRPAAAFSKMYCGEDSLLRQAVAACRTFATQPAHKQAVSSSGALAELKEKSDALRKQDSSLTEAQAFLRVYEDPANVDLIKRERAENRPHA